jgi:V/A-type H+-transporting ATPase subunit B
MALTAAEYFAVEKNEKVHGPASRLTLYDRCLVHCVQPHGSDSFQRLYAWFFVFRPGKIYEKAVQFPDGGSITIIAVTTLSGGDITHAIPDNTGYITEGQLFLRRDNDVGKVIVDPFRSLSRSNSWLLAKRPAKTILRLMNAAGRLFADAANAKTKLENGFDLSDYDERCLDFAKEYSSQILAIDVNIDTTEMLDTTWKILAAHFRVEESNIKQDLVNKYMPKVS